MLAALALILAAQTATATVTERRADLVLSPAQSELLKTERNLGGALVIMGSLTAVCGGVAAVMQEEKQSAGPGAVAVAGVAILAIGSIMYADATGEDFSLSEIFR